MNTEIITFDWIAYYNKHKERIIAELGIKMKNRDIAWYHWNNFGKKYHLQYFSLDNPETILSINPHSSDKEFIIFDWKQYIKNYPDLGRDIISKEIAWNHWYKYGKKEERSWEPLDKNFVNDKDYKTFEWEKYVKKYPDLNHISTKIDAWKHWANNGKQEGRTIIDEFDDEEYQIFDWKTYVNNYDDLSHIHNKIDAWNHWSKYGKNEMRMNFTNTKLPRLSPTEFSLIPSPFSTPKTSVLLDTYGFGSLQIIEIEKLSCIENTLLIEKPLVIDSYYESIYITKATTPSAITNGIQSLQTNAEDTEAWLNTKDASPKNLNLKQIYKNKLEAFMDQYNIQDSGAVDNDPKIEFRYFCFKYLDYMRNCFITPELELNKSKEAVFVEFREFPHVEFLIRNAIMRLGSDWSYTVVCGNENYNFMIYICNNISKNIKIIKTVNDNISISEYNYLLKSVDFWEMLIGDTILIYQEDSFIFNDNIEQFIQYDYIGAPWHKGLLPISVGNGGISLRSKQVMIDVIEAVNKENKFIKEIISEDVFFSKHMQRLNIGSVADWDTASQFSSELFYNGESFAGHQFWLSDSFWKNRLYDSIYSYMDKFKTEILLH